MYICIYINICACIYTYMYMQNLCPVLCFLFFNVVLACGCQCCVCAQDVVVSGSLVVFFTHVCAHLHVELCTYLGLGQSGLGGVYVWGRGWHSIEGDRGLKQSSTIPAIKAFSTSAGSSLWD